MEHVKARGPKDEQITNRDDAVTNKDGDNYLEKGAKPTDEAKKENVQVPTVTPDKNSGDPGPPAERNKDEATRAGK